MKDEIKFVVCLKNTDYPASLELHKIYQVTADEKIEANGEIRVVDESGEDYIYPADWFVALEVPVVVKNSLLKAA